MIKCNDCENVFEEEELKTVKECMGEYFGTPAYEEYKVCPFCDSSEVEEI